MKENSIQGTIKTFVSLKKEELIKELSSQSIKYPENAAKSNLEIILKKALKRTVRVPILIKKYSVHEFEIFNLEQYEMTLVETILDIEGNITNLFDELPEHLNKNDKQLLLETTGLSKQQKEILRNVDKRKMSLYVILNLYGKGTNKVILLLKSLADVQKTLI